MIIYCTSTTQPYAKILGYAQRLVCEYGSGQAELIEIPTRLTPNELLLWTDKTILRTHEIRSGEGYQIIAGVEEAPVLRILRRIREATDNELPIVRSCNRRWIHCGDFLVHCLTNKDRRIVATLRVSDNGEFLDVWPEGFFDWRMPELF